MESYKKRVGGGGGEENVSGRGRARDAAAVTGPPAVPSTLIHINFIYTYIFFFLLHLLLLLFPLRLVKDDTYYVIRFRYIVPPTGPYSDARVR